MSSFWAPKLFRVKENQSAEMRLHFIELIVVIYELEIILWNLEG